MANISSRGLAQVQIRKSSDIFLIASSCQKRVFLDLFAQVAESHAKDLAPGSKAKFSDVLIMHVDRRVSAGGLDLGISVKRSLSNCLKQFCRQVKLADFSFKVCSMYQDTPCKA